MQNTKIKVSNTFHFIRYLFIPFFVITNVTAQEQWPSGVPGYGGSYTNTYTPHYGAMAYPAIHYQRPTDDFYYGGTSLPQVSAGFTAPMATHEWWSSAIWNFETYTNWLISPYSFWMHPHPWSIGATRHGIKMYYSDMPLTNNTEYDYNSEAHLYVGVENMDVPVAEGTKVKDYGDWHVTLLWEDGTGRTLEATSAHGSPYVFFKKSAGHEATFRFQIGIPAPFATTSNPEVDAYGYAINLGGSVKYYGIFVPSGTVLGPVYPLVYDEANVPAESAANGAVSRDAFNATMPSGHNYFSVAVLPDDDPATLGLFAEHAFAFITDSQVEYSYNEATAVVTSTFNLTIENQGGSSHTTSLQALYPHQWNNLGTGTLTSHSYEKTARGEMRLLEGNTFSVDIVNHGFLTAMPSALNPAEVAEVQAYIDALYAAGPGSQLPVFPNASPYDSGVRMSRLCNLIHLANRTGRPLARDMWLEDLKTHLEYWFRAPAGKVDNYFYYDNVWNTLIGYPSAFESDRQLNDHHFHYAYYIKAAATIAQYEEDNDWVTEWGPMVEMLIKDVANWDREDHMFPFLRNFDPYAGHSWASGHANFQKGNNQESSSEAINFASAMALWGIHAANPDIRNYGIALYANEVEATRRYWFNAFGDVFPTGYDRTTTGILWGSGVEYRTWFGGTSPVWNGVHPEYVHGIQLFPHTGGSMYLGLDTDYINESYSEMISNMGGNENAGDSWREMFWMYRAFEDPSAAIASFEANPGYIPNSSESTAHTYSWLHTLDSIGKVYGAVTADIPTYTVFDDGLCRHYAVYNYGPSRQVNFSDGASFVIPEDTLILLNGCEALPVSWLSFTGKNINNEKSKLEWSTAAEINNDRFEIFRLDAGNRWENIGMVTGNGNTSSVSNYFLFDYSPKPGINYYKIRQVDFDGNNAFSKTIAVNFSGTFASINIYPNPANDIIVIETQGKNIPSEYIISVKDVLGRALTVKTVSNLRQLININDLSSGVYFIEIHDSNTEFYHQEKIIKQ